MAASMDSGDVPDLVSDNSSDNDFEDDDNDWEDVEDCEEQMSLLTGDVTCLFCSHQHSSVGSVVKHCKEDHGFDLIRLCHRWSVDCISYIKMINFIRKEGPTVSQVTEAMIAGGSPWHSDDFMQAADPSDLMLQMDIEWAMDQEPASPQPTGVKIQPDYARHGQEAEAIGALVARLKASESERDALRDELGRAVTDMEALRLSSQQLVMSIADPVKHSHSKSVHLSNSKELAEEDGYFASYSHHGIHMTMLKDKVRTESYRDFMVTNGHLFEGKTVLDIGCGTGILSLFAVKAGAKQVVAVDSSQIIFKAMDIARRNGAEEKITFVHGKLEDVSLPVDKFDVIVSEWMGYFLLFEAMLDSVLWARDRYLAPGGCVYPDVFSMMVAGVSDPQLHQDQLLFWEDVYGYDMTCMKGSVTEEVHVRLVKAETVVTQPAVIKTIDVKKCRVSDLDFSADFSLQCQVDADITAIVGYFDTFFDQGCSNKVEFSTGPHATSTHWEQAVMMLPKPIQVKQGESLSCHIDYHKHPTDDRGILIGLTVGKLKLKFHLS